MSDQPLTMAELLELEAELEHSLNWADMRCRRAVRELIALREEYQILQERAAAKGKEATLLRVELAALKKAAEAALECIGAVHPNAVGLKALRAALAEGGTPQVGVQ